MQKLNYIRRQPGIMDFNLIVDKVNEIIERMNAKVEIEQVDICRVVKDFKFFKGEEVRLPYHADYTLVTNEDATKIFDMYNFSYKEMSEINNLIIKGKIIKLSINVSEEVTEKEIRQEIMFETVNTITTEKELNKEIKKVKTKKKVGQTTTRGRKKKLK